MPRWLSEGISTYEEQEKNDSWGERLTIPYRQMIAGDDLTPVSQLSAAFLSPKSPQHLQFAYFEASLVVRYLIEKHGLETLKRVLTDLGVGMPINESLERYVGSLQELDEDFAAYARDFAQQIGPEVDWRIDEELAKADLPAVKKYLEDHPRSYQAMLEFAKQSIAARDFESAKATLLELRELYPEDREGAGTLALLGSLYRQTEDADKELEVLSELARLNDRALEVYARLIVLHEAKQDWDGVRENALRYLSVQPVLPYGHEQLGRAAEELGKSDELATSLAAMLEMDPIDPADIHYKIAKAYQQDGSFAQAKRHVLMALEYAPRYRDAQKLLLMLTEQPPATDTTATVVNSTEGS